MDKLKKAIDDKRNIKQNSLNAYIISITKLYEAIKPEDDRFSITKIHRKIKPDERFEIDFLMDIGKIKDFLSEQLKLSTQKNYLSAIIVALDAMNENNKYDKILEEYRNLLDETHNKYVQDYENGAKSESQEKNWTTMKELRKVMNRIYRDMMDMNLLKKDELDKKQLLLLQQYIICNLFLTPENPPTRLDYAPMEIISQDNFNKLDEEEQKENNYLVVKSRNVKFFSFNEYKTSGKYGQNNVKIGKKLNSVLNIWLRFNKTDSLLLNTKLEPMSANGLGKEITKIFSRLGKNISVNMLRHIFISEKYPNLDKEKKEDAIKMGHSVQQQSKYSKT